ncbi:TonB-dependent receptor [Solilutibacter silvestris]|uniref:Carboxypeptidase regulatory-like domain-containing protein n=1 Tax=Solilutibacter silvestris TaxID=1645665 RepID=A0A2K1PYA1_9GAMM|nr:TonB-dependent receptor [Lysobacter silvestris]PNS07772.1 Carboxypeptidase regulatory-like domain-containing protein [Lysobacter silvestris]
MAHSLRAARLSLSIAALLAATPLLAQNVTTSAVAGRVLDASGKPVAGATITITHEPTGTVKEVSTDGEGRFGAQGLRVGGPFDIKVKSGAGTADQEGVFLQLGQTTPVNFNLNAAAGSELGTVTVTGSKLAQIFKPDNKGLSTVVSTRQLHDTPQGNRSIDDVARLDPRVNVLDPGLGTISIAGMNNRYNSVSVDGVSQSDPFGLNANGLPYLKSPISAETIAAYNISPSNYDVISDSVGADVNAVTKSGGNQYHGSLYYSYRDSGKLMGKAGWLQPDTRGYKYTGFDRDRVYGFTFGGPIIEDKLFFFLSAEHEKTSGIGADSLNGLDPSLGQGASTSGKVSPGDLQKVIDIATKLGLKPGVFGGASALAYDDKRYLAKFDWNINNNHRVSLALQRNKNLQPAVGGNGPNSVGLTSYTYTKAITTDNYVVHLFDDWTDSFTTETKIGLQHFVQDTTAPWQQPAVSVNLDPAGKGPTVNLGEERYRHYNHIDTRKFTLFAAGTYTVGSHAIKGGFDYQRNKIYNMFGQAEFGVYSFYGLANFANAQYQRYDLYHPAPGYALNDIAGAWTYSQLSPFIQDTWQVNDRLSMQYGVRVDVPRASAKPVYNANFANTFGYANNTTVGAKNYVIEPRFSFNYTFNTKYQTQLRGGVGLFQTSPPTVWMTNPYQNNGVTLASYTSFAPATAPFSADPMNQPIPTGSNPAGSIDVIDPNFKLPTVWKASLAIDRETPVWGLVASAEYLHIQVQNGVLYQAVNFGAPTGTLPDGRLSYWNPNLAPGKAPAGSDALYNQNRAYNTASTLLGNTHKGKSDSLTLALTKPLSHGFSGSFSYTLSHATEVDPGADTVAFDGYRRNARTNPNSDIATVSNYNIPRTVKLALNWEHKFFGNYRTQASLFYSGRSGNPYTWVFGNDANGDSVAGWDPAYIPGVNDPKVAYAAGTSAKAISQFQDYLAGDYYLATHRGQIADRNGAHAPWSNTLDFGFTQELPGIFKGNKGEFRLDLHNLLNLLNKHWGQTSTVGTYPARTLVNYAGVNAQGQYLYSLPTDKNGNYAPQALQVYDGGFYDPSRVVSRWSLMATVRYTF